MWGLTPLIIMKQYTILKNEAVNYYWLGDERFFIYIGCCFQGEFRFPNLHNFKEDDRKRFFRFDFSERNKIWKV